PRGSAVMFGRRARASKAMPDIGVVWTGRMPALERTIAPLTVVDEDKASGYQRCFRQGATLVPRMLFLIERRDPGLVRSVRTSLEKPPWRDLPALEGPVEREFIWPVFLGEHVLPHRTSEPAEAVIPWDSDRQRLLSPSQSSSDWWRRAEAIWNQHRSSDRLSIVQQLDYHNKLTAQYPIADIRVVYAASGMHLCAARIQHHRAVVSHSLYWSRVDSVGEARYLCAILNAACVTDLVRPYMAYGKDERHIDKHVWKLPIPLFDPDNRAHLELAEQAAEVEAAIAGLELDDGLHFAARRRRVREFLERHPTARKIEARVARLLDQ